MKEISDSADREAHSILVNGLETTSKVKFFPQTFTTYLLGLKLKANLPVSILPPDLFEKPVFKGKTDFFHRLSSELISFGLAYQRIHLEPIPLSRITFLFHKHRPWWQCDIQDIEKALSILKNNEIIQELDDGYLFEPFSVSNEIRTFLTAISDGINDYGEISLGLIKQLISWEDSRILSVLEILENNRICIIDKTNQAVYFPEYQNRD
jgi:hypothetical protein